MEFSKNNTNVPKPFWMFCLELAKFTGQNVHIIKALKIVSEIWKDRLVNGTYKVLVKDLKNDLKEIKDGEDGVKGFYDMGITLKQLMCDDIVNEAVTKIEHFFKEHFIAE